MAIPVGPGIDRTGMTHGTQVRSVTIRRRPPFALVLSRTDYPYA